MIQCYALVYKQKLTMTNADIILDTVLEILIYAYCFSSSDEEKWRESEEKKQKLAERQRRLRALLEEDEKRYQQEREDRHRQAKTRPLHQHFVYPEVGHYWQRLSD